MRKHGRQAKATSAGSGGGMEIATNYKSGLKGNPKDALDSDDDSIKSSSGNSAEMINTPIKKKKESSPVKTKANKAYKPGPKSKTRGAKASPVVAKVLDFEPSDDEKSPEIKEAINSGSDNEGEMDIPPSPPPASDSEEEGKEHDRNNRKKTTKVVAKGKQIGKTNRTKAKAAAADSKNKKKTGKDKEDDEHINSDDDKKDSSDEESAEHDKEPNRGQKKNKEKTDYAVQKILGKKMLNGKLYYLLQWKGFSSKYDSWEPKHNLDCTELMEDYEKIWEAEQAKKLSNPPKPLKRSKKTASGSSTKKSKANDEETPVEVYLERDEDEHVHKCLMCNKGFPNTGNKKTLATKLTLSTGFTLSVYEAIGLFFEHFRNQDPIQQLEPIGTKKTETRQLCSSCASLLNKFCSALQLCVQACDKDSELAKTAGDLEEEKKYFKIKEEKSKAKKNIYVSSTRGKDSS